MRRIWLIVIIFFIVGVTAAAWWLFRTASGNPPLEKMIAGDVLGMLLVREFPDSLEYLDQTRLGRWLELKSEDLREEIPESIRWRISELLDRTLQSAGFALHNLEKKENGAWRVHFTAFLMPYAGQEDSLGEALEYWVEHVFGTPEFEVFREGEMRIYRGQDPGEMLYRLDRPEFLLISNSEEGWEKTLETLSGRIPSLYDQISYRKISMEAGENYSVFLYLRAGEILSLAPEFGYAVKWNDGAVKDRYFGFDSSESEGAAVE